MKLILDHCVPNRAAQMLAAAGHQVILLKECLPTDSSDLLVIEKAEELDAVLLSLNGDFADITAYPPAKHRGLVALQVKNRPEALQQIVDRLIAYLVQNAERRGMDGKLLIVEPHRIRVRAYSICRPRPDRTRAAGCGLWPRSLTAVINTTH